MTLYCLIRRRFEASARSLVVLSLLVFAAVPAWPRDLQAVSDGMNLWLVTQDRDDAQGQGQGRLIYHTDADQPLGQLRKLDPLPGQLMPRGIAAGDGRLLMIDEDRQLVTIRPVWSPLLRRSSYDKQTIAKLPEGCTLLSLAIGSRGPWALVKVEDPKLLAKLDQTEKAHPAHGGDRRLLNRALKLPDSFVPPGQESDEQPPQNEAQEGATQEDETGDAEAQDADGQQATTSSPSDDSADELPVDTTPDIGQGQGQDGSIDQPEPKTPAYRLVHLAAGRWVSVPLPEGFVDPKYVVLLMRDEAERPTLLVEPDASAADRNALLRYTPVLPIIRPSETAPPIEAGGDDESDPQAIDASLATEKNQALAWAVNTISPRPGIGRLWSAALIDGQVVYAVEAWRSTESLGIDAYLLRGDTATGLGQLALSTEGKARWSALPWAGGVGAVAMPGPILQNSYPQAEGTSSFAGLVSLGLDGDMKGWNELGQTQLILAPVQPSKHDQNADLYIQIGTFLLAMTLLLTVWAKGRLPRPEQIDLPEHIVLASFFRRIMAGLIDLMPGFLIASLLYDTSINETMLFWPGNGVDKVLSAMRPGFTVILVTVAHTAVTELIIARSLGKWVTGLYVTDLSGRPAAPLPAFVRGLSRVFDLLAPLMLVVALISPARQRLGDILVKTTVVMRKPEPFDPEAHEE